ncbi:hypothetical protein OEZ60_20580 [Defluviimonas sp. WL0024]|uniref:Uncharacterized protein n=1 Tax=Albidovulum salinarum TaxID=2984153 RepID=A0ABT2X9T0_9RHOB|nr:hypothetical protein [Defluviimonas sp. WL0024]MCU9850385.1 hypothetical protein [Defluviimonas sp. WL0024]
MDGGYPVRRADPFPELMPCDPPAGEGAGARVASSLRALRHRLVRFHDRIEQSLLGDLIGAIGLITAFLGLLVFTGVLQ